MRSDDNVEVGAALYEIDTEAEASLDAAEPAAANAAATEEPKSEPAVKAPPPPAAQTAPTTIAASTDTADSSSDRAPSIHFLGKDGWAQRKSGHEPTAPVGGSGQKQTVVVEAIHPMYGRPKFSEAEMEALLTGGASMAPNVLLHSSGAKFGM
jgi:pyruvate/2-oxoglutarate dehydrogenase complex dihydrolipoamide acyltransferase (E2) component